MNARMRISAEALARERKRGPRILPAFSRRLDSTSFAPVERQPQPTSPRIEQHQQPLLTPVDEFLRDETWCPPGRRRPPKRVSPPAAGSSIESEIDDLYREVRRLIYLAETDPQAEAAYQRSMSRLRELQASEAKRWVARFRERCALSPGAGYAALKCADELIAKYAHLAPANRTAEDPDRETSPAEPSE